jgi:hypothetical protein
MVWSIKAKRVAFSGHPGVWQAGIRLSSIEAVPGSQARPGLTEPSGAGARGVPRRMVISVAIAM